MAGNRTDGRHTTTLEEQARRDLPYSARHFQLWIRARLFEHWNGVRYWADLDRSDFGLLWTPIHPDAELVADVVALLVSGGENLTVITWAIETDRPLDDVVAILTVLDVNCRRFAPFACLPHLVSIMAPSPRLAVRRCASTR